MEHPPILLVEDDPNAVFLIDHAFRKEESAAALQVVPDGEQAIHYLAGQGPFADRQRFPVPSVMVLDLRLPRRSGFEVLAWLRAQPGLRRLPVIVLTSSGEPKDVNQAYDLGANSYLVKPASIGALRNIVEAINRYWLSLNEQPELTATEVCRLDQSLRQLPETHPPVGSREEGGVG